MNKHMNQLYLATDQLLLTLFTMSSRVDLHYKAPSLIRPSSLAFWKVLCGRFYCITIMIFITHKLMIKCLILNLFTTYSYLLAYL